jgi:hypothetical protein
MLLKSFNEDGFLPEDYGATFQEIRQSLLVLGPERPQPTWDVSRRRWLLDNLEILVRQLWAVGIERIHVNGSFVTDKDKPGDIDACFECDYTELRSGRLAKRLNDAAPEKIWTWFYEDRIPVPKYPKGRLPMWVKYRVEIFPYGPDWPAGVFIDGTLVPFPDAFRRVKNSDKRKGILLLKKGADD